MNKDELKNIGSKAIHSHLIFKVCLKFTTYLKNNYKDSL